MSFSIHNPRLLSRMVAGAVALAAASACSHSDRASAGRDTTLTGAAAPADTQASVSAQSNPAARPDTGTQPNGVTQPSPVDTTAAARSTGNASSQTTKPGHHRHRRPRTSASAPAAANGNQDVAGYKAMGQDSSAASTAVSGSSQISAAVSQPSDTSATRDSSVASPAPTAAAAGHDTSVAVVNDTTARSDTAATEMAGAGAAGTVRAGSDSMARDTSTAVAQADTTTIGDTGVVLARPDTTEPSKVAVRDSAAVGDSTAGGQAERIHPDTVSGKADELAKHEPTRVRPPADSADVRGHVAAHRAGVNGDAAAVGAAGMASTGNIATGAEAVAQMTRQAEQCSVVPAEENRDVLWDMASSPSTLNPCGTGTMTLPRIWTGEKK